MVFAETNAAPKTQIRLAFRVNVFREMTAGAARLVTGNPNWHGTVTIGGKLARSLVPAAAANVAASTLPKT